MRKVIALLALGLLITTGYKKYKESTLFMPETDMMVNSVNSQPRRTQASTPQFRCDGRTHCSQMRSCEEAKYFIRHCPNTKMDGDRDGVPCEQQWC